MSRPYLSFGIEALEQLSRDSQEDEQALRGIEHELHFRSKPRSVRLLENVKWRLEHLNASVQESVQQEEPAEDSGDASDHAASFELDLEPEIEPEISSPPVWDDEQLEAIHDEIGSWQLVVAGPGTGKSAVACQRVAYLVDEGVPPSRILVVSFTRTAVAELRDRIVAYAVAGEEARNVRISTIDSNAWSLRVGFDDEPLTALVSDESYDVGIQGAIQLIRDRHPDLMDYLQRLEHLIIDEAQDVVGPRAQFVLALLGALQEGCGVTILADPNQAIYGFTTDEEETGQELESLLELLRTRGPKPFLSRRLQRIHRIKSTSLQHVFELARHEVERASDASDHVGRVQAIIRQACGLDLGKSKYKNLVEKLKTIADGSSRVLVLFRRRADVLMASSHLSQAGVEHRLRMSGMPVVVSPWIGWLFNSTSLTILSKGAFVDLWARQSEAASAPFERIDQEVAWGVLHRLAAARRPGCLDLAQLRLLVARPRPPIEICEPELGVRGPILGTIHASKGREADTVVLLMPGSENANGRPSQALEEGRVYYVGATRARHRLFVATNASAPVSYLESGRIYRLRRNHRVQLEVGCADDVDRLAHLAWGDATTVQQALAAAAGRTLPVLGRIRADMRHLIRIELNRSDGPLEVGEMSRSFYRDLNKSRLRLDGGNRLRSPQEIQHLYLAAVTTVGLTEEQRSAVGLPFSQSGFALAPVVRGYPTIPFFRRGGLAQ